MDHAPDAAADQALGREGADPADAEHGHGRGREARDPVVAEQAGGAIEPAVGHGGRLAGYDAVMKLGLLSLVVLVAACSDDEQVPVHVVDAAAIDAAIDAAPPIDGPPPVDAPIAIDAAPTCAGTVVGGHCWYRGAVGESCTAVCATHGAIDPATVSYAGAPVAGSRANQANCQAIVTAFAGLAFAPGIDNVQDPNDFGCGDEPDKNRSELISLNATVATSSNPMVRRYCACTL